MTCELPGRMIQVHVASTYDVMTVFRCLGDSPQITLWKCGGFICILRQQRESLARAHTNTPSPSTPATAGASSPPALHQLVATAHCISCIQSLSSCQFVSLCATQPQRKNPFSSRLSKITTQPPSQPGSSSSSPSLCSAPLRLLP